MEKHIEKTVYLENQSRWNNLRFEGLLEDDNETWDETETIVKNGLVEKLDFESAPEVKRAHRTEDMMELQNRERTFACFSSYKANNPVVVTVLRYARSCKSYSPVSILISR